MSGGVLSRRAVLLAAAGAALSAGGTSRSMLGAAQMNAQSSTPHPPRATPPLPPFIGDPVPGVDLHPAATPTLQSFAPLPETGEWFTTQARPGTSRLSDPARLAVGDIVISRLASDGSLLDSMTLPDSGHGMGLIVRMESKVRVVYSCWYAPVASGRLYDVVRLPYNPGVADRRAATAVITGVGYPLDVSFDVSTAAVTVRHQGGRGPEYTRHDWSDFEGGNLTRPTGQIATADWPPTHQGFCSLGNRFFFYTGAATRSPGGDPPLITEYSWASGQAVGPSIDASGNSRQPDGSYIGGWMEPEGAAIITDKHGAPSLLVGVANGSASAPAGRRSYRTFRYPLVAGHDSARSGRRGAPPRAA